MRAALLISIACVACGPPPPPAPPARAAPDEMFVSASQGFSLRPIPGWRLLRQDELPRATSGGAVRIGGGRGLVLVEPVPGMALDAAAARALETLPPQGRALVAQEPLRFAEHDALRQTARASIGTLHLRYVTILFFDRDRLFRLIAMDAEDGDVAGLDRFFDAFELREATGEATATAVQDAVGADWIVSNGRFASLGADLAIEPAAPFSLLVGEELARANADAQVGLQAPSIGLRVAILAERTAPEGQRALTTYVRERIAASLGEEIESAQLDFLGQPLTVHRYRQGGLEHLHGMRCDGELCRQLIAWYPIGSTDARAALDRLPPMHALDDAEASALAVAIAGAPRTGRTVGETYALRGARYVDFARGMRCELPAGWSLRSTDAGVQLRHSAAGLYGVFVAESLGGQMSPAEYHAMSRAAFGLPGTAPSFVEASAGELSLIVSEDERDMLLGRFRFVVATAVGDGRGQRFGFWGWPAHVAAQRDRITELLAHVTLSQDPLPTTESSADRFTDHRFGYELAIAQRDWTHEDATPRAYGALAAAHAFHLPDGSAIETLAARGPDARVEEILQRRLGDLAPSSDGAGELAGLAARHRRWETPVPIDCWVVHSGEVGYALIVHGGDAEAARRGFSLLP